MLLYPSAPMGVQAAIRATAVGIALSLAAWAAVAARTPELLEAPAGAFSLWGPIAGVALGCCWGAALLLGALGPLATALGAAPGALVSPRVLWSLGALLVLFSTLNEAIRASHALELWKWPLRSSLFLGAAVLAGRGLTRARAPSARLRRIEAVLAAGLVPALLASAAFFGQSSPRRPAQTESGAIARAPRFTPEPRAALAAVSAGPRSRILILGLDGASWDRIDRGIADGRLPSFARLVREGLRAPLGTLYPTYSPRIWNSLATGVTPEEHGVEDFYLTQLPRLGIERLRLPRSLDPVEELLDGLGELHRVPVTSSLRRRKAIWNLADEAGLRAAVIGFWASWPPELLDHGLVVSDHASLAKQREWLDRGKASTPTAGATTHPAELAERLAPLQRPPDSVTREELAQFLPVDDALWDEFQATRVFSRRAKLSAFRSSHLNDAFYFAAARRLWDREQPDLMFVYAKAIDELSHFFYEASVPEAAELGYRPEEIARYRGVVDRAYEWTDRQLAPLIDAVDRDRALLIVVSDHGWEKERDGGYNHSFAPPGILILYGAGVCRENCPRLEDVDVYDVAPTVLERLRLPLSDELRGRPLREAFEAPRPLVRVARYGGPERRARVFRSELDAQLTEKLEALGYLE